MSKRQLEQMSYEELIEEIERRGRVIRKLQTRLARRKRQWKKRLASP